MATPDEFRSACRVVVENGGSVHFPRKRCLDGPFINTTIGYLSARQLGDRPYYVNSDRFATFDEAWAHFAAKVLTPDNLALTVLGLDRRGVTFEDREFEGPSERLLAAVADYRRDHFATDWPIVPKA